RVERAAHKVVAHAGQVLHTTATDQHHRGLLQTVALTAAVGRDLNAAAEAHAGALAERRGRLLGRHGTHLGAHTALLRSALRLPLTLLLVAVEGILQCRCLALLLLRLATLTDQLIDCWHTSLLKRLQVCAARQRTYHFH